MTAVSVPGIAGSHSAPSSSVWSVRADRYSELRSAATEKLPKVEMFALGG